MSEPLQVRNLASWDSGGLSEVLTYLLANPDPGIRARPEIQIQLALATGLILTVKRQGQICACSFVYKFAEGAAVFNELGTMLVTANGLRLQQVLAQLHLVQLFLEEYYSSLNKIFAVVKSETASEHILRQHAAMEDWDPPPSLIDLRARSGAAFAADKMCLVATEHSIRKAFADLKSLSTGENLFRTPKGGEKLRFEMGWFDVDLLSMGP